MSGERLTLSNQAVWALVLAITVIVTGVVAYRYVGRVYPAPDCVEASE